ncbi:hypothetical protein HK101_010804 [Irineochytrium annulatum]|nr:hypothetical protein HK101_010804 [Irineochytrium annulatum]
MRQARHEYDSCYRGHGDNRNVDDRRKHIDCPELRIDLVGAVCPRTEEDERGGQERVATGSTGGDSIINMYLHPSLPRSDFSITLVRSSPSTPQGSLRRNSDSLLRPQRDTVTPAIAAAAPAPTASTNIVADWPRDPGDRDERAAASDAHLLRRLSLPVSSNGSRASSDRSRTSSDADDPYTSAANRRPFSQHYGLTNPAWLHDESYFGVPAADPHQRLRDLLARHAPPPATDPRAILDTYRLLAARMRTLSLLSDATSAFSTLPLPNPLAGSPYSNPGGNRRPSYEDARAPEERVSEESSHEWAAAHRPTSPEPFDGTLLSERSYQHNRGQYMSLDATPAPWADRPLQPARVRRVEFQDLTGSVASRQGWGAGTLERAAGELDDLMARVVGAGAKRMDDQRCDFDARVRARTQARLMREAAAAAAAEAGHATESGGAGAVGAGAQGPATMLEALKKSIAIGFLKRKTTV